MFRIAKYVAVAIFTILAGGLLLLGPGAFSYMRTSAVQVRESVQQSVPIDFELRRAKVMIDGILPDLQSQIRLIAQEEVEIAALKQQIQESKKRLDQEQTALVELRQKMDSRLVSFQEGERRLSRTQLTQQLARRFDRFKAGQIALNSKEKLLQKRQQSLDAAFSALDTMRHRKAELELQVESLAAQARILQATESQAGVQVDSGQLSSANELIDQIETRLAVAQRVLEHEQDWFDVPTIDSLDEEDVLSEFDAYFGDKEDAIMVTTITN